MNQKNVREILKNTDFVHRSGTPEERQVAEYLLSEAEKRGAAGCIEEFDVEMATVKEAHLIADGVEIPCRGYRLCGSGNIEAPFMYLPNTDPASLVKAKGKIVLLDTGVGVFAYKDFVENGIAGIITYDGNVRYPDHDIDEKELRKPVRGEDNIKTLAVNINAKDAFRLVKMQPDCVKISVEQEEFDGRSQNVIAEIPGITDEWIVLTAHYDTTPLSHGSYDNMTGCIGLLAVLDAVKDKAPLRYGIRVVFCGSEERGLLGSKAYTQDHEEELNKVALNINLDMIGSVMGRFIACASAEDGLVAFVRYYAAIKGFGIAARQGVYSSDSTPFADHGVPAISFARLAGPSQATIHNRYDTPLVLSEHQIVEDCRFISDFTLLMADAVKCPVKREIPDKVKNELDEYMSRKRREM